MALVLRQASWFIDQAACGNVCAGLLASLFHCLGSAAADVANETVLPAALRRLASTLPLEAIAEVVIGV